MADQAAQAHRVISLTEFPDGPAILEIEGEKPIDLSAGEVKAMRVLFKPQIHCKDCGKLYPAPVAIDGPGCQCREKPIDWSTLIARLKSAGMTQTQIADACGVSDPSISDLARGKCTNPSYRLGARLLGLADTKPLTVLEVLDRCERDFAFIGGCTLTDRPDLPLSADTSWQIDVSHLLESIRWAKQVLGGAATAQA